MKKILVTTDFSDNSKAGLLFAMQLAAQSKFELTFFHVCHVLTPTAWNSVRIAEYEKEQVVIIQDKLNKFVEKIYKKAGLQQASTSCVVKSSVFPQSCIMEYALNNNFDFICISTRGAGKLERFLGTNTGNLINHSDVPVIAVPYTYKPKALTSILYASDLANLEKELKNVAAFAKPLKAKVELLHFTSPLETIIDQEIIKAAVKQFSTYDIKLNISNTGLLKSLVSNIEAAIKKSKPSMLIMFTEQNRSLFQKIFLSGNSAEYSFESTVPLLVFNKS